MRSLYWGSGIKITSLNENRGKFVFITLLYCRNYNYKSQNTVLLNYYRAFSLKRKIGYIEIFAKSALTPLVDPVKSQSHDEIDIGYISI